MEYLNKMGIHTVRLDVTYGDSMTTVVESIIQHGSIDVLVNNAGYGSLEKVSMSEARRQIEVNLLSLARISQLIILHIRKKRYGKIINISSIGGKFHEPPGSW